jgi:hypothetical protein
LTEKNGAPVVAGRKVAVADLQLLTAMMTRTSIAAQLGKSFEGRRDMYANLGYPTILTYEQCAAKEDRHSIGRAAVWRPVKKCWSSFPRVTEGKAKKTRFETEWDQLAKDLNLYSEMARVDALARIGSYAVLFLGFDDADKIDQPVKKGKLVYITPFSQQDAQTPQLITDPKSPRNGWPQFYNLSFQTGATNARTRGPATVTRRVDPSRVIHIALDRLSSKVFGRSALSAIYNDLQNMETIGGGSAEMYWRGAFPGFNAKFDEDASPKGQSLEDAQEEIEAYVHDLKRYMQLSGISIEQLEAQFADPTGAMDLHFKLVSAGTEIPLRILLGSEAGELASSQDERNWNDQMEQRRRLVCEPDILRPTIDRCIEVGAVSKPRGDYVIEWPPLSQASPNDQAAVASSLTSAIASYTSSRADQLLPPVLFLRWVLKLTDDQIEEWSEAMAELLREDQQGQDPNQDPEADPAEADPTAEDQDGEPTPGSGKQSMDEDAE